MKVEITFLVKPRMTHFFRVMLAGLLVLLCQAVKSEPLLLVSTELPPYAYTQDNRIVGFNVELLREAFQRIGVPIEFELLPWARAVQDVQYGDADAIFPFFYTAQRAQFTDYSAPFTSEPTALFVLTESAIQWQGQISELTSYRFGRVRGYRSGPYLDQAIDAGTIQVEDATDSLVNLRKLLGGRFDIMIENEYVAYFEARQMGERQRITRLGEPVFNNPAYLGFAKSRHHENLIPLFDAAIESMRQDGSYDRILERYLGNET